MLAAAYDAWTWQHVLWGAIYALVWAPRPLVWGVILSWEAWEAVGRRIIPDDGIFAPESWGNIALDITVAALAFHATRALLRATVAAWDGQGRVAPAPFWPMAAARGTFLAEPEPASTPA